MTKWLKCISAESNTMNFIRPVPNGMVFGRCRVSSAVFNHYQGLDRLLPGSILTRPIIASRNWKVPPTTRKARKGSELHGNNSHVPPSPSSTLLIPFLRCHTRLRKSLLTPVYRVPFDLFVIRYLAGFLLITYTFEEHLQNPSLRIWTPSGCQSQ